MHPGKEPSPLARVQTMSVGMPTTTTTQGDIWSIDDNVEPANPSVRSADVCVPATFHGSPPAVFPYLNACSLVFLSFYAYFYVTRSG
jgi:hypothetical protein